MVELIMTEYSEWACKLAVESGVSPEAIDFIFQAIDYIPNYRGQEPGLLNSLQHATAQDCCHAFVGLAKDTYGTDYIATLEEWDLTTSEKLGAAIYRLMKCKAIERQENDRISDFDAQFDLSI